MPGHLAGELHAPPIHLSGKAQSVQITGQQYNRKETEFDRKTGVWTVYFDPSPPPAPGNESGLILNFYGWTPATTAEGIAQAWNRQESSAQTIFKFQAPDAATGQTAYFILSETPHPDRGYGYANITKIATINGGAYAVTYDRKLMGKDVASIDAAIKSWLLSDEAKTAEKAVAAVAADPDWRDALPRPY